MKECSVVVETLKNLPVSLTSQVLERVQAPQVASTSVNHIKPDRYGEYTVQDLSLKPNESMVFYDGLEKVAEVVSNGDFLSIRILTDKQVNIFSDISAKDCFISSKGPLCIDGKLDIQSSLQLSVKSLCLFDEINCQGNIDIDTIHEAELLGKIAAKDFTLNSARTTICQQLQVDAGCKINTEHLIVGSDSDETTLKICGNSNIQAVRCEVIGHTSIKLDGDKQNESCLFIEEELSVADQSTLNIARTQISAKGLHVQGEFCSEQSTLKTEEVTVEDGLFTLSSTDYEGDRCHVFSGEMNVDNNTNLSLYKSLIVHDAGSLYVDNSDLYVNQGIRITGTSQIKSSTIVTDTLQVYRDEVDLENCKVTADKILFSNGALINNSTLIADKVTIRGKIESNHLRIDSDDLEIKSRQANIQNLKADTNWLTLTGSHTKNNVKFSSCKFNAKNIAAHKHMTLVDSSVKCDNQKKTSHQITGRVKLVNSKLMTNNQIHTHRDSYLKIKDGSVVKSKAVCVDGRIKMKYSELQSDCLTLDHANYLSLNSVTKVNDRIVIDESELTLSDNSVMSGEDGYVSGIAKLNNKSAILFRNELVTGKESEIYCNDSKIDAVNMSPLGKVSLDKSVLSAEMLSVYDNINVMNESKVDVKSKLKIASKASASVDDGNILSEDFQNNGVVSLQDASIISNTAFRCGRRSTTSLQGKSEISGDTVMLSGKLNTKSNESQKKLIQPKKAIQRLRQRSL